MNKTLFYFSFLLVFVLSTINIARAQGLENETVFKDYDRIPGYKKLKKNNPEVFQGNKKKENYFEGWYFKMVSQDDSSIMSIIPGISLSENGEEQHAFIQIIDGKTAKTYYYTYPIEDFSFSKEKFAVRIQNNYFSEDSISINIKNDTTSITGKVKMTNQIKLTKNGEKLNIMGWYKSAPFMQCHHGVVSLNHDLSGSLQMNNTTYNFDKGLGYIEKDWGKSMPSAWIWIQSNSFDSPETSFMLSVANVPWMGSSFPGFLGFFLNDSIVNRFGTYSGAKLQLDTSSSDIIKITITDKDYTYYLETSRDKAGILKAPVKGAMERRIAESIDAQLKLTVTDKNGTVIFEETTSIAGLETVGNLSTLSK